MADSRVPSHTLTFTPDEVAAVAVALTEACVGTRLLGTIEAHLYPDLLTARDKFRAADPDFGGE